jgi:hypothetical protein
MRNLPDFHWEVGDLLWVGEPRAEDSSRRRIGFSGDFRRRVGFDG